MALVNVWNIWKFTLSLRTSLNKFQLDFFFFFLNCCYFILNVHANSLWLSIFSGPFFLIIQNSVSYGYLEAEPLAESVWYNFLAFRRNASLEAFWLPWEPRIPGLCSLGTVDTATIAEICVIINFMEKLLLDSNKP